MATDGQLPLEIEQSFQTNAPILVGAGTSGLGANFQAQATGPAFPIGQARGQHHAETAVLQAPCCTFEKLVGLHRVEFAGFGSRRLQAGIEGWINAGSETQAAQQGLLGLLDRTPAIDQTLDRMLPDRPGI